MIPKSQDNKLLVMQPSISFSILIRILGMLPAINFNHQAFFQAHKIDNIPPQWLLATEFQPINLPKTKLLPE
jgi:hypothetical protein